MIQKINGKMYSEPIQVEKSMESLSEKNQWKFMTKRRFVVKAMEL